MRNSQHDRQVVLQERTRTPGASGEEVESWTSLGRLWASKRDMRAGERWAAQQLVAEIETVWILNWWPGWETIHPDTHRLVYRDRVYEIHGLREIGRHEGIEVATAARAESPEVAIQPPTAENVTITGNLVFGQTLTGSYDYSDPQDLPESGSSFQWYRADDDAGTNAEAISGATALTYVLTVADLDEHIRFGVVPNNGSVAGEEAFSDWEGPVTFTFAALFATPVNGLWIDPSDLSSLWQDQARTVPVTADGQTVLGIDDKSGNGNFLSAPSAGPTYRTDGTLHWLEFNGTNNDIQQASGFAEYSDKTQLTRMVGVEMISQINNAYLESMNGNAGIQFTSNTVIRHSIGSSANYKQTGNTFDDLAAAILTSIWDADQSPTWEDRLKIRKNAVQIAQTGTSGTVPSTTGTVDLFYLCSNTSGSARANLKLFQYVGIARNLTASELSASEDLMAELSGVTL